MDILAQLLMYKISLVFIALIVLAAYFNVDELKGMFLMFINFIIISVSIIAVFN